MAKTEERFTHKAAQLWCLPHHENKAMDVEFAFSIAEALQEAYNQGVKDGQKEEV